MVKKNQKWEWTGKYEKVFKKLKERFIRELVLAVLDLDKKMRMKVDACYMQVHLSGNNVPAVKPPSNHTNLPFIVATFLATCLMAVLQPSGYSVFHGRDTPIQLSLP